MITLSFYKRNLSVVTNQVILSGLISCRACAFDIVMEIVIGCAHLIIVDIINESMYNMRFNGGCFGGRLWQTKSCILTTSNA